MDFTRCKALNTIPEKKIKIMLDELSKIDDYKRKTILSKAYNRYIESNLPVEYWYLNINKDFKGYPPLLEKYKTYVSDIKSSYMKGASVCFSGGHGRGKTFVLTSILKEAAHKDYTCLYTTLSDVVSVLITGSTEDKFQARRELCMVDFLVIDEFDSRFMSSDNSVDLYARTLETIFRARSQNKLPTLLATNSPNILKSLNGSLQQSMASLANGYLEMFVVLGDDFREKNNT